MKVIISGSRHIVDYKLLCDVIQRSGYTITRVLSGHAVGVDILGERWAREHKIPCDLYHADWNIGKAAGPRRNRVTGEAAAAAIIVWDGKSPGTKNMREIMIELGKPYYMAKWDGEKKEWTVERQVRRT